MSTYRINAYKSNIIKKYVDEKKNLIMCLKYKKPNKNTDNVCRYIMKSSNLHKKMHKQHKKEFNTQFADIYNKLKLADVNTRLKQAHSHHNKNKNYIKNKKIKNRQNNTNSNTMDTSNGTTNNNKVIMNNDITKNGKSTQYNAINIIEGAIEVHTNISIPQEVRTIISLGPGFILPQKHNRSYYANTVIQLYQMGHEREARNIAKSVRKAINVVQGKSNNKNSTIKKQGTTNRMILHMDGITKKILTKTNTSPSHRQTKESALS